MKQPRETPWGAPRGWDGLDGPALRGPQMWVRPTLEAAFFWASGPCGGNFSLGNRKVHPSQGGRGRGCCLAGSAPGLTPARPSNAQLAKAAATSLSRTRGTSCLVATASSLYLQQHLSMSSGALPGARAMLACILALIRSTDPAGRRPWRVLSCLCTGGPPSPGGTWVSDAYRTLGPPPSHGHLHDHVTGTLP